MTGDWLVILTAVAATGGVAAMQAINVVVLRSAFMPVFLGTAILSAVAAVFSGGDRRLTAGGAGQLCRRGLVGAVPAAMGAVESYPHAGFDNDRCSAGLFR